MATTRLLVLAAAAAAAAAAEEEDARRGARLPFLRPPTPPARRTSFSELLDAASARGSDVSARFGRDGIVSYTVGGERRECVAPPPEVPHALVERLHACKVRVSAEPPPPSAGGAAAQLWAALLGLLPAVLLGALGAGEVLRARRAAAGQHAAGGEGGALVPAADGFATVAGLEHAVRELREVVDMLIRPEKYAALGLRPVRGVLLVGPPGTGKTLLARALAAEAGVRFYARAASEFHAPYIGEGARAVRDLFAKARDGRARTPAIVFLDELDALGASRGGSALAGQSHREYDATLTQLLACMDGALAAPPRAGAGGAAGCRVLVLAATNRYEALDRALTRPGRFDRVVHVRLPNTRAREKILKLYAAQLPAPPEYDMRALALRTRGLSGAQLAALVNEAALRALRRGEGQAISEADLAGALEAVRRHDDP